MNEKINEIQDEIIEEFSQLNDWFDKYEYIISLGKNLKSLDENIKSEENSFSLHYSCCPRNNSNYLLFRFFY